MTRQQQFTARVRDMFGGLTKKQLLDRIADYHSSYVSVESFLVHLMHREGIETFQVSLEDFDAAMPYAVVFDGHPIIPNTRVVSLRKQEKIL